MIIFSCLGLNFKMNKTYLFVCVQRAAPTRRVSAMRAASVGATQPSTDKLKVQTHIFYDFTDPCVYNVANIHFCEAFCNCISVSSIFCVKTCSGNTYSTHSKSKTSTYLKFILMEGFFSPHLPGFFQSKCISHVWIANSGFVHYRLYTALHIHGTVAATAVLETLLLGRNNYLPWRD